MEFNFTISDNSGIKIILTQGKLMDKDVAEKLLEEIDYWINLKKNRFIVDLSSLEYLNSTGLNVLINLLTKARNSGGELIIARVSDQINKLLLITKLNSVFKVSDSIEQAVKELQDQTEDIKDEQT